MYMYEQQTEQQQLAGSYFRHQHTAILSVTELGYRHTTVTVWHYYTRVAAEHTLGRPLMDFEPLHNTGPVSCLPIETGMMLKELSCTGAGILFTTGSATTM